MLGDTDRMIRSLCLASVLLIFMANAPLEAQERASNVGSAQSQGGGLRRRALVIDINARVLEDEKVVIWNETHRKVTIPGNPVGIKLFGSNIVVAAQFTPVIRRHGNVLVAQGQIWIEDEQGGISYYTLIQTIPMDFNEPIYFFPLGTTQQSDSAIEIILTVNPYSETTATENEN